VRASEDQKRLLGPLIDGLELRGPKGCSRCHGTGYAGRIGIFELLLIDENLQDMIADGAHKPEIRRQVRQKGYETMLDDGLTKLNEGLSSLDELIRVLPYREISIAVSEAQTN
jgi:type II secretory ATPase GspE/PulE/Tfp pilus assembly ATPase PilB-like protein